VDILDLLSFRFCSTSSEVLLHCSYSHVLQWRVCLLVVYGVGGLALSLLRRQYKYLLVISAHLSSSYPAKLSSAFLIGLPKSRLVHTVALANCKQERTQIVVEDVIVRKRQAVVLALGAKVGQLG